jgi:hypothetical protein
MAKAHIITADGSTVDLEGTQTEIAALLKDLKIQASSITSGKVANSNKPNKKSRKTVNDLLDELIEEKFFKQPQGLGDIRVQLANLGHLYPVTSLSGPLQGYVKKRKLRRSKKDGKYLYNQ